jgi:hypothetical protein
MALRCFGDGHSDFIEQVRENSLNYVKQLPNFLCEEVVKRYTYSPAEGNWVRIDTVTAQLSYFEGREEYTKVRVNDKIAPGVDQLQGAMGEGEFGTLMRDVFLPESGAEFEDEHRKKLHGREMSVFKFDIKKEHSRYKMTADEDRQYVAAFRGEIFVDDDTKMVMRLVVDPYGMPSGFPVKSAKTTLDYEMTDVGGTRYLLPVKAEILSEHHRLSSRNVEEFKKYRKFHVETNLTY